MGKRDMILFCMCITQCSSFQLLQWVKLAKEEATDGELVPKSLRHELLEILHSTTGLECLLVGYLLIEPSQAYKVFHLIISGGSGQPGIEASHMLSVNSLAFSLLTDCNYSREHSWY